MRLPEHGARPFSNYAAYTPVITIWLRARAQKQRSPATGWPLRFAPDPALCYRSGFRLC